MTATELVHRALRLIGVVGAGEAAEAEDAADALDALNSLFAEWRGSDIFILDYDVENLASELTIDRADRDSVAYQLALRLAPEYGKTLSAEHRVAMDESFSRLRLRYFQPGEADLTELPRAAGQRHGYDIERG